MSHPKTKEIFDKVMKHCRPFGPCYEDCLAVVREISKLPCYHGDMWDWQRNKVSGSFDNKPETVDWYRFYAAFDSCTQKFNNCVNQPELLLNIVNSGTKFSQCYVSVTFSVFILLLKSTYF